jgi:serine carboxypeptidase-like clade 1
VDESKVELFYYFVKSERNPIRDPVILWLTGGPGCSAFSGFIYEIGPLNFRSVKYNGNLPTLVLNPNSWTKLANIIFLDLPVGTGFSYATTSCAFQSDDIQSCNQAYQFLKKWFISHPEYISNPVYIAGDSYSGITVPIISQLISEGNDVHPNQYINLQGYILGNPTTNFPEQYNYKIPFAHGMGIISDEHYQSLVRSCRGEYQNINPNNVKCRTHVEAFEKFRSELNEAHILEPYHERDSAHPKNLTTEKRALSQKIIKLHGYDPLPSLEPFSSRVDGYWLSYHYMNDISVRNAFHIRNGTIKNWARCDYDLPYNKTILDSRPFHLNLSKKGYRSLVYSGDHDMVVPYIATQVWIRQLNYSIVDDWRSWKVNGQVAG